MATLDYTDQKVQEPAIKSDSLPRIHKLDEAVINRIAAGEVIQRPAAAIKELVENALDAGATAITVTVQLPTFQTLSIQDNGHGIHKQDFPMLCHRFTTSKLHHYSDMKQLQTFGFRGEALASMSLVSRNMRVISRRRGESVGYKARFVMGEIAPWEEKKTNSATAQRGKDEIKPCAANEGTTITLEDLFYNVPLRQQTFQKQGYEEYQKIVDVIMKYSLFYGDQRIVFTCKKWGQTVPDYHTNYHANQMSSVNNYSGTIENIKLAYGVEVARELVEYSTAVNVHQLDGDPSVSAMNHVDDNFPTDCCFEVRGKVTNANFSLKKAQFICFINARLIENNSLKKAIDQLYQEFLPKHAHPFVFLSIR